MLEIENILAQFFDSDAIRVPPYQLRRFNAGGIRYYYVFNDDGDPVFYPSVTSVTRIAMPTPVNLIKWMCSKGYEEADAYKQERADYGTFMHMQQEKFLIDGHLDLGYEAESQLFGAMLIYAESRGYGLSFVKKYIDELKKDLTAFALACFEREVKPIAIEIPLKSDKLRVAGTTDLVCKMKWQRKEVLAIWDFKGGKNGFYAGHEAQLHLLKTIWNENFPDQPVEYVFNWSGKDWKKAPSYNLQNQTDSIEAELIESYARIAWAKAGEIGAKPLPPFISGRIHLGTWKDATVSNYTISEYVKLLNR